MADKSKPAPATDPHPSAEPSGEALPTFLDMLRAAERRTVIPEIPRTYEELERLNWPPLVRLPERQ